MARPGERPQVRALRRWYAAAWVVFGLVPPALAVWDQPDSTRSATLSLLSVIGLCYPITETFPGNPALRRFTFLGVLVAGIGAVAYLMDGAASLLIVSLPHFWILAGSPRRAVVLSGAAAAAAVAGDAVRSAPDGAQLSGNSVAALIGYAAGVLFGLWMHRVVGQHDARARLLAADLEDAERRLAEAQRRQGAADERERLAREIHDTLAQGFASIVVLAEAARTGLRADPDRSAQQLLSIEQTARENLAEARVLVGTASAGSVAPASVARTLRRTLDRFAEDTGLTVTADLPDVDCDQTTRIALLRCTQESLANIRKHAAASTVGVVLERRPHGVELEITDDGRGFAVAESRGFGLDGMRRRLAELGGELTVTSSPGDGTRVLATIPAKA
ncbi:sensor histidine kinase [Actinomadura madurae]|uniref:sensor histidine kinase n=1 Tax=Actinomadura madurae TaxID=1993 RepID=UPI00202732A1|nr:sensor histidine kinase [Actinomadura madurae]MCP9969817.1 sensor histidine kinase [Actinomadura madurae]MCP9982269.1 sensor histidine kinase [Actinomadura madurae]MCQ0006203.1 sensor histidine kinase [Actinomadura madurae]URN09215.1 sensor histidine kinase [Actinomadura madurae]